MKNYIHVTVSLFGLSQPSGKDSNNLFFSHTCISFVLKIFITWTPEKSSTQAISNSNQLTKIFQKHKMRKSKRITKPPDRYNPALPGGYHGLGMKNLKFDALEDHRALRCKSFVPRVKPRRMPPSMEYMNLLDDLKKDDEYDDPDKYRKEYAYLSYEDILRILHDPNIRSARFADAFFATCIRGYMEFIDQFLDDPRLGPNVVRTINLTVGLQNAMGADRINIVEKFLETDKRVKSIASRTLGAVLVWASRRAYIQIVERVLEFPLLLNKSYIFIALSRTIDPDERREPYEDKDKHTYKDKYPDVINLLKKKLGYSPDHHLLIV